MIDVHLMKINGNLGPEQCFPDRTELDFCVRKLPFLARRWFDCRGQRTAKDLMAETYARKSDFGFFFHAAALCQ